MKNFLKHLSYSLVNWLFRNRSPALLTMRSGIYCMLASLGFGWFFDISIPYESGSFSFRFNNENDIPVIITYGVFLIGALLAIGGFTWAVICYRAEQHRLSRKRVFVIESRGLRDTSGSPLCDALPENLQGHREQIFLDMREHIKDGVILHPEAALKKITSLPENLRQRENGLNRSDITIAYGGLTPVPFTFLTGVLIDDENSITTLDWDRHQENWRPLNGKDDGKRFQISGIESISDNASEIALAISVSYHVDLNGIQEKLNNISLVHMELEDGAPDCHWSEEKQRVLGQEFLNTVINLGNRGIKRIHLFIAGQNSVVFRFGRLYDKRNLPEVVVYQYQKEHMPPYPWGLFMPLHGTEEAIVVR